MWKQIRSLFGGKPAANEPPAEFIRLKEQAEGVLRLELATPEARDRHEHEVLEVLVGLDARIEQVCQQANGYPDGAISGEIWMDGVGYAGLARGLADHFKKAGWLELEQQANGLWAKSTLAVCSHYRHMVGPAMLANGDCYERMGNPQRAVQFYTGVVKDFVVLIEMWESETEPDDAPLDEDRLALESLQTALERLLALHIDQVDGNDLTALQSRLVAILARPQENSAE